MKKLVYKFLNPVRNEEGQGMVEYGLIIALVAVVIIGALVLLGGNIAGIFKNIAGTISSVSH